MTRPDPNPAIEVDYTPEPAPSPYLLPVEELAKPPAPLPDEAVARLAAAAARRKLAQRRKLSASIARRRRVSPITPPAPMRPEARPLPARAVPMVEVPDTAANRLKAIRAGLRDLRGGRDVDLEELARPARLWPELQNAIRSGDRFTAELAMGIAEAFICIEIEKEWEIKAGRKNSNQFRVSTGVSR